MGQTGVIKDDLNQPYGKAYLETADPYVAFARILQIFISSISYSRKVSSLAYVDPTAILGEDVTLFPSVFVGPCVRVGRRTAARGVADGVGEAMRVAQRRAESSRQDALDKQKQLEWEATEREQAAAELRRAEERTRSVVENVLDGIITIDEYGLVQTLNSAGERLFGYKAEEVVGQNVRMLMPEPYHHEHDKYISDYLDRRLEIDARR